MTTEHRRVGEPQGLSLGGVKPPRRNCGQS